MGRTNMKLQQTLERVHILLVVAIFCQTGIYCRAPPQIDNVNESNTITIRSSEKLVLTCKGTDPVSWKTRSDIASRVEQTYHEDELYHASIVIQQAVYNDTGLYSCLYKDARNPPTVTDATDVYVFVKDANHPLLPLKTRFTMLPIQQTSETIIRCLPTSLDVNVTLWKGLQGQGEQNVPVNGVDLVFDPTKGFIISFATLFYSGDFHCVGQSETNTTSLNFNLVFILPPSMVPTPEIELQDKYAAIGSTFRLVCLVRSPSTTFLTLNWTYPDSMSDRIVVGKELASPYIEKKYKETTRDLTITSVRLHDEGSYTCTVMDHTGKSRYKSTFVEVKEAGEEFINLIADFDVDSLFHWNLNEEETTFIKWIITVESFPSNPKIEWYKHDRRLSNGTKYIILNKDQKTTLTINNVEGTDSAEYFVVASTGKEKVTKTLNITLFVLERPKVKLSPDRDIYRPGEIFNITCKVEGCPPPNITWEWSPCNTSAPCKPKYHDLINSEVNAEKVMEYGTFHDGCHLINVLSGNAAQPGYYKCVATNDKGINRTETGLFISRYPSKFSILPHRRNPYEQDKLELSCQASGFYYASIKWLWKPMSSSVFDVVTNATTISITEDLNGYVRKSTLQINPVVIKNAGTYKCLALTYENKLEEDTAEISVKKATPPVIYDTNMNNTQYTVYNQDNIEFYCRANGSPKPDVHWYLNGSYIQQNNNTVMQFEDEKTKLIINRVLPTDTGNYVCVVSNRAGNVSRNASLLVLDASRSAGLSTAELSGIIVVIVIFIIATIVFGLFLGRKLYRERKEKMELEQFQHMLFDQGDLGTYNPMLPLEEQIDSLPYDKRWEFPKERLKLGKVIGQGAFGRVIRAEATGIVAGEEVTTVAVKMLKERADWEQRKALMQELKIMIHLGRNLHVVNVLGAVTQNLHKGEFQVIVEYCRFGNLRHYLLRHRENYIDQINPETGEIDMAVRHRPHQSVFFSVPTRGSKQPGSSISNNTSGCVSTTEDISTGVTTDGAETIANHRVSAATAKSIEALTLTTYQLICYAYQICCGMQYLVSKKLVHRDLALRNVLLADGDVVKICDFGLTKDVYSKNYYRKKGKGALPVKWMAIESIRDRVFSSESDVWSYGIVLWELCTLGGNPYPGLEVDEYFYRRLLNGHRMDKPQLAPQSIYDMMMDCWQHEPKQRPKFDDIATRLSNLLDIPTVEHYQQLSDDYLKPENIVGNPYYLSMLPSENDYYNEDDVHHNHHQDRNDYIENDGRTIGMNAAKGTVNYANLPSPLPGDSSPDQRTASYGDKKPSRLEMAPMLTSNGTDPFSPNLHQHSGDQSAKLSSTNPFLSPTSANNNTNPFLPHFDPSGDRGYLEMGNSISNLADTPDVTFRAPSKDAVSSPPPRDS